MCGVARPRSEERRSAILAAAMQVIAAEGLGAATATIARRAGVSNGSLFTYFPTKADLLNQLYIDIKKEMGAVIRQGISQQNDLHGQMIHMWNHWIRWAVAAPEKRRVLQHLNVSPDLTPESRKAGFEEMAGIEALLQQSRAEGPLRDAPLLFVLGLINAVADATIDFMIRDPANAERHCNMAAEAAWQMLAAFPAPATPGPGETRR